MIVVRGVSSQSGFGVGTFNFLKLLNKSGYNFKFFPINAQNMQHRKGFSDEDLKFLDEVSSTESISSDDILIDIGSLIYGLSLPDVKVKHHIFYTLTETTSIHPDYVNMLNNKFDEIWTASNFNKVGFFSSGVVNEVKVLPLSLDLDKFNPSVPKLNIKGLPGYMYLFSADLSYRKGLHHVLRGWTELFNSCDDVGLILKLTNGNFGLEGSERVINPLNDMLYYYNYDKKKHAKIFPIFDSVDSKFMPSLYKNVNMSLSPNHGEGFGYFIAESMACGTPVITTRCSAQIDFFNKKCGLFVDVDSSNPTEPIQDQGLIQRDPRYTNMSLYNPSYESFKEQLKYSYEHKEEMVEKGNFAREYIIKKLGFETLSKKLKELLDQKI